VLKKACVYIYNGGSETNLLVRGSTIRWICWPILSRWACVISQATPCAPMVHHVFFFKKNKFYRGIPSIKLMDINIYQNPQFLKPFISVMWCHVFYFAKDFFEKNNKTAGQWDTFRIPVLSNKRIRSKSRHPEKMNPTKSEKSGIPYLVDFSGMTNSLPRKITIFKNAKPR
jgi:hypothetical protein